MRGSVDVPPESNPCLDADLGGCAQGDPPSTPDPTPVPDPGSFLPPSIYSPINNPLFVLTSLNKNNPNYYVALCKGSSMMFAKQGCMFACLGTEPNGPLVGGIAFFNAKQIWQACQPGGQTFCPSMILMEGTLDPATNSHSTDGQILSCVP